MKDFINSTKMQMGHNFHRSAVTVPAHQRAMPVRKPKMAPPPTVSDAPTVDVTMAKGGHLDAAARKAIPKSEFGLPGERKYPVDTKARAANAKARATQQVNKGNLSESAKAQIDRKANRILGKAKGGEVFEGSAKDVREDRLLAKKHGMSMKDWEKSSMDTRHDAQRSMKGLRRGGMARDPRTPMISPKSGC